MIFQLNADTAQLPDPELAEDDGLLAVGGDLSPKRLLNAYQSGIFPWYSEETPILWYAPAERFVLYPAKIHVAKSMRQFIRQKPYRWTVNEAFEQVIEACATATRKDQDGTWIVDDMRRAYGQLHQLGFAHSVEVWNSDDVLVGGLYGVLVGKVFSGESMFSRSSNASKYALIQLATQFKLELIDCQIHSDHLARLGAEMIARDQYLRVLDRQSYQAHGLAALCHAPTG